MEVSYKSEVLCCALNINASKYPSGYPLHRENRENGKEKIPVRENKGNLGILSKHGEFGLL